MVRWGAASVRPSVITRASPGVAPSGVFIVALFVQKYGGSSVADAASIKRVAKRIVDTRRSGHDVVVAVSAMGDTTDELLDLAAQVAPIPAPRELDMLLSSGERISMALLAMAIHSMGFEARSFTGSQAGHDHGCHARRRRASSMSRPSACAKRSTRARSSSSPASRASTATRATSRRSAGAAPTRPPWRSRRRSRPTCARSTATWTASSRPIPAWCRRRRSSRTSRARRCSSSPPTARRCCTSVRSNTPAATAC